MQVETNVDPNSKIRIKKFFENQDAREYVRQFLANSMKQSTEDEKIRPMPRQKISEKLTTQPSLSIMLDKGIAFDEFQSCIKKTELSITVEIFGSRHRFDNITACQCPNISQTVLAPLPCPLETICNVNSPLKVCVSTTKPETQFIGLGIFEWRKVLYEGSLEGNLEIKGSQDEIVGIISFNLSIVGISGELDFGMFKETLDLQIREESIAAIENDRQTASDLKIWWKELTQLIDDRSMVFNLSEIGSGKKSLFRSITPFTKRELFTPGHCLVYTSLFSPLILPNGSSILPNWACIASKCAGEREKVNILVSLLRGFGLNAFAVIGQPYSFAVIISSTDTPIFFNVNNCTFSKRIFEDVKAVNYIFNDRQLFANLKINSQASSISWDLTNPLLWKQLDAPPLSLDQTKYSGNQIYADSIAVLKTPSQPINEAAIEKRVKEIIENHRNSVGLTTKWNDDLESLVYPLTESYERETITGESLGIHSLVSDALREHLRPKHRIKVVPIHSNTIVPQSIFKAILDNHNCLSMIGSKEDQLFFILTLRIIPYPDNLYSTWVIVASDSVEPLFAPN